MSFYVCEDGTDSNCPFECTTLEECEACHCAIIDQEGGPWGNAMDVILCLCPILFLLIATLKKNPIPTTVSLPLAAFLLFLVRVMYLGSDPLLVSASVISGVHEAMAPLAIMCGAIFLFETMEATLCMPFMLREMKLMSGGHVIAELMLLFGFAYMVEGAAGFGTPAALGAPMLASLGYPKLEAVITLLLMNTFATVWGAVGTPIWFGFGDLELSEDDLLEVSYKAGVALFIATILLLPTLVLRIICPSWKILRQNIVFIILSLSGVMLPSLGLSFVSYEFSSLIGGMIGCMLTAILIRCKVGLRSYEPGEVRLANTEDEEDGDSKNATDSQESVDAEETEEPTKVIDVEQPLDYTVGTAVADNTEEFDTQHMKTEETDPPAAAEALLGPRKSFKEGYILDLIGRTFPLWGTVLMLILTRIEDIGLKDLLTRREPSFEIDFGTYGTFRLSASLVLQLNNILSYPKLNWKFELLYIPFILPFVFISILTMIVHRRTLQTRPQAIVRKTLSRLRNPAIALLGALVLVRLLINRGPASPAVIIGTVLSDAFKEGWIVVAAFLGALGSFFSGSTTVSNLTFGGIQQIAAENIGTSPTAMLALQATGASAGNGICLNNIIAACAVVGLNIGEGKVIARTGPPVLCICLISTIVMLAFFFRF